MQRMHESTAPRAAGIIALGRNPLRLTQMDMRNDIPRVAIAATSPGWPIIALRWLVQRLRRAFLTAGSPTSVPPAGATDDAGAESRSTRRPGGSMLRRME